MKYKDKDILNVLYAIENLINNNLTDKQIAKLCKYNFAKDTADSVLADIKQLLN